MSMTRRSRKRMTTAAPEEEKAYLAGLVELLTTNPARCREAVALVKPSALTIEAGAELLAAVAETAALEAPTLADLLTIARNRTPDQAGDVENPVRNLIAELWGATERNPGAYMLGVSRHAKEVAKAHKQRRKFDTAQAVASMAADDGATDGDVIAAARRVIQAVEDGPAPEPTAQGRLVLVPMSEIESSPVNWLWPQRIVGDGLTIITGPVGNTKSLFTIDMAARVSLGSVWPDGTGRSPMGSVILFGAEDDAGKIVRPRLEAAGADLSRVMVCQGATTGESADEAAGVILERHITQLRGALDGMPDCRLIVFDPLPDYLAADQNDSAEVRAALMPLVRMAQEKNVAVVAVLHQNKKNDLTAVQRIAGSSAFAQIARTVLAIGDHPEDDAADRDRRRVMLVSKNNYGERNVGQSYRLSGRANGGVCLEWIAGIVTMDADAVYRRPNGGREHDERRGEAVDVLREHLAGGPASAAQVHTAMQDRGLGRRQIEHAAESLNVIKEKRRDGWYWRLPAKSSPMSPAHVEPHPEFAAHALDEISAFNVT